MLNLGICRKCQRCSVFRPALVDGDGNTVRRTYVECQLAQPELMGWDGSPPDGCPYVLEHKLSEEAVSELEEEEADEEDEDDDA
jgi:hypothetical protein